MPMVIAAALMVAAIPINQLRTGSGLHIDDLFLFDVMRIHACFNPRNLSLVPQKPRASWLPCVRCAYCRCSNKTSILLNSAGTPVWIIWQLHQESRLTRRDPQLTGPLLTFIVSVLVSSSSQSPQGLRFGIFEIDLDARELRKNGLRVRLQDQPFKILAAMARRAGEVIPREELYSELSSHSSYDFKHGLNNAIQKIREVLGDSPENARFIETVPNRGYRFLPPVEVTVSPTESYPSSKCVSAGTDGFLVEVQGLWRQFLTADSARELKDLLHRTKALLDTPQYSHPNRYEAALLREQIEQAIQWAVSEATRSRASSPFLILRSSILFMLAGWVTWEIIPQHASLVYLKWEYWVEWFAKTGMAIAYITFVLDSFQQQRSAQFTIPRGRTRPPLLRLTQCVLLLGFAVAAVKDFSILFNLRALGRGFIFLIASLGTLAGVGAASLAGIYLTLELTRPRQSLRSAQFVLIAAVALLILEGSSDFVYRIYIGVVPWGRGLLDYLIILAPLMTAVLAVVSFIRKSRPRLTLQADAE
jgi:DNA-binding winged helix-turn-helix (wHTH) protein